MIPQCAFCKKMLGFSTCEAYPEGIPPKLFNNEENCDEREDK